MGCAAGLSVTDLVDDRREHTGSEVALGLPGGQATADVGVRHAVGEQCGDLERDPSCDIAGWSLVVAEVFDPFGDELFGLGWRLFVVRRFDHGESVD